MSDARSDWWRRQGEDRLALLLWAVWNPIGPVPLDEYASYTGRVESVLRRAYDADVDLTRHSGTDQHALQLQRNKIYEATLDELSALLGDLRERHMGMPSNSSADRRAAETLHEWYEWEMETLYGE